MRVLFIADLPEETNSGAAGTELQTIDAMRRLGVSVETAWSDSLPHKINNWNLHYLLELPFGYRKLMLGRIRREKYDVIHVNQPHGYLAAKALPRSNGKPVFIHRSHGFEMRAERDLQPWRRQYDQDHRSATRKLISRAVNIALTHNYRGIARYADGHIVSASQCRDFLREQLRVPMERIAVIPQAAPNLFLEQPSVPMTAARLRRVLHVGQLAFFKAPMITSAAIRELAAADVELEFTWVCSKEHHTTAAALLPAETRARVRFLDWMPQEELCRVYDEHGVFLFPSFFEGFGKVFLEAMSRGLCVVAADNGGARDLISEGVDGILATTGDVKAIVNACLRLLRDPQTAARMSEAAAITARAYTWDRVARETIAFYEDRIEAKTKRGSK